MKALCLTRKAAQRLARKRAMSRARLHRGAPDAKVRRS
jgi:hypothetical protein